MKDLRNYLMLTSPSNKNTTGPALMTPRRSTDMSEISYLELYHPGMKRTTSRRRPLIDNVKPQPKACMSFLQMPKQCPKAVSLYRPFTDQISILEKRSKLC